MQSYDTFNVLSFGKMTLYLLIHILKVETEVARLGKLDYVKLFEKTYVSWSGKSN